MEPQETTVEAIAESSAKSLEVAEKPIVTAPEVPKPDPKTVVSAPKPTKATTQPSSNEIAIPKIDTNPQITADIWQQVITTWNEYFGEGKKANVTIAISVVAIIPLLIAVSALLDFLNKLPILPSIFELVGFGYSIWFVYRYLLLANTRKELSDAIAALKNKILG